MTMLTRRRLGLGLLPLGLVLAGGCSQDKPQDTGIIVEVSSDLLVPTELNQVRLLARNAQDRVEYDHTFDLGEGSGRATLPLRAGLYPLDDASTPIHVEAVGQLSGQFVVSRGATLSFVPGKKVVLVLPLWAVCKNVQCMVAFTTCKVNGICETDGVRGTDLPNYVPNAPVSGTDAFTEKPDVRLPLPTMDATVDSAVDVPPPADVPAQDLAAEKAAQPSVEPGPEPAVEPRPEPGAEPIAEPGPALLPEPSPEPGPDSGIDVPIVPRDTAPDLLLPRSDARFDVAMDAAAEAGTSSLGVVKNGAGGGTITSSPAGIDCGGTCAASFTTGTVVTLTATTDGTSTFMGWSGACSGTGECTVTVDGAKSVTATFDVLQYGITVSKSGTGGGTVTSSPGGIVCGGTCSATFAATSLITLTATADATSTFTGWSGACSGTGPCAVTVDGAKAVTAYFDVVQYTLTVSKTGAGGGSITSSPAGIDCGPTCTASFTTGAMVTLTPTADGTSIFTGWSGACSGTATCTVSMDAVNSATANFDVVQNGLNIAKTGTGGGTVTSSPSGISCGGTCSYSFTSGTQVTLTAAADGTSTFTGWSGSCSGTGTCLVTADAAKSVTANFDLIQFGLTVGKTGTGGGTVTSSPAGINCGSTCAASFTIGAGVTLTAVADATSTFTGWSGACSGTGSCLVTMSAANAVTANFDVIQYTVNASKSGTGGGTVISSPSGIACGTTCGASFNIGTVVTFSANPDATSIFTGWSGSCSGPGGCSVTADAARSVTATFMKTGGATCTTGTECASGNCLDDVCCTQSSCPQCQNCGASGACSITVANADDATGTTCMGTNTCDGSGACRKKPGLTCGSGTECASGNCLDGVCCTQSSCPQCRNCGTDGSCSVTIANTTDTTGATCTGTFTCDTTAACICATGYAGTNCNQCASGYTGYPSCVVVTDPCVPDPCNGHGTCAAGTCSCSFGFTGPTCGQCDTGYSGYPSCAAGPWVQSWKQVGETTTSYFGSGGISYGPDANGDGIGDVLVGAPGVSGYTGAAYLYSGKDGSLLQAWTGEAASGNFGGSVSLGPDVTGDGRADVLIAAYTLTVGAITNAGKVYLYNGATGAFIRSWSGSSTYGYFGNSVSLGPDTNGDGRGDVLVGSSITTTAGQAFLYSGSDGSLLRTFTGSEVGARFGTVVFLGADVTGDGRGDLLVAENMATVGGMGLAGKVYLYSGASGALLRTWSGEGVSDRFGLALSIGPDADGDGKPDVAIGTGVADDGLNADVGKAYLYSSSSGSLIRSWKGPYAGARLGDSVSLGPDADGDGRGDILVGSASKNFAALFSSATGQMLNLWTGTAGSQFGWPVWLGPSMNGDSKPEVVIAAGSESSGQGTVRFYTSNRGACAADCTGKCGGASDGCGGTCTTVPSGSVCSQQFLVPDPCLSNPCNSRGTCNAGACTCFNGFTGTGCDSCNSGYSGYPFCSLMVQPSTGLGGVCFNTSGSITCPSSGQAYYGQDGNYQPAMRFLDLSATMTYPGMDGIVLDQNTGLVWEKNGQQTGGARNYADTWTACDNLARGGLSDWRVPSLAEFHSIVDFSTAIPYVPTVLEDIAQSDYWTSTTANAAYASNANVMVRLGSAADIYPSDRSGSKFVRCVRGTALTQGSFVNNGNGTISDNATKLMWQQQDDATQRTWANALAYCEGLSLASKTDWRMPSRKELWTIIDPNRTNPAMNTGVFLGVQPWYYWSATRYLSSAGAVDGMYGGNSWPSQPGLGMTGSYYTRCVRAMP